MIPNIIHFVWIGSEMPEFAKACIQQFRKLNTNYRIMVHDEGVLLNDFLPSYGKLTNLCSKSDLIRLSALKKYGGWYFDTDFFPLKPIDILLHDYDIDHDFFVTRQAETNGKKAIANGIIGLSPTAPVWDVIWAEYDRLKSDTLERTTFGPELMTRVVQASPELCCVGKKTDFYPYSWNHKREARRKFQEMFRSPGFEISIQYDPFCIHLWAGGKTNISVPHRFVLPGEKTAVIVANNRKPKFDFCYAINSADLVVRMNRCIGFGNEQGKYGQKSDVLGIVSSGSAQFLRPIAFMRPEGRVGRQLGEVWFARPKGWKKGMRKEASGEIVRAQSFESLSLQFPSYDLWQNLIKKLQDFQPEFVVPSSGMIFIEMLLNSEKYSEHVKYLAGFTHKGWRGHPFEAEAKLIQAYIEKGLLFRAEETAQDAYATNISGILDERVGDHAGR